MTPNGGPSLDETLPPPEPAKGFAPVRTSIVHALPAGHTLAEFQIERVLGEGGFGIVYLARDLQLERQVALKEYMPGSLAGRAQDLSVVVRSEHDRPTFELGLRSFVNEAKLLAQLDHPTLVKAHRFWQERGTAYMVMPYYQGQTLKRALSGRLPPDEAWLRALLEPLLDVLAYLHSQNIYHRDVSPDNILLLPNGKPVLLDFGAARLIISDATQNLTAILKPGYAPVEQYAESGSTKQGAWTDIYALAAVLYFVVGGKPPLASVARLVHDDMPSAVHVGQGRYSTPFLEGIDACLAVRPEQRPRDVAAARYLLSESVGQPTVLEMAATPPPGPVLALAPGAPGIAGVASDLPARRFHWGWAALLSMIAAGSVAVAWVVGSWAPPQRGDVPAPRAASPVLTPSVAAPSPVVDPVPSALPREAATVNAAVDPKSPRAEPNDVVASVPPLVKARAAPPGVARTQGPKATAQCDDLLQRLSLGEDSEALRQKLATLGCR